MWTADCLCCPEKGTRMADTAALQEQGSQEPPQKKGFKLKFPNAITVLFIVMLFAQALTWVVPAGNYSKFIYDSDKESFVVTHPDGSTEDLEASQDTLKKLGISGKIEDYTSGAISKPVAIPGTYQKLDAKPQGPLDFLKAPVKGVYDTIDIILFVFLLGGCIGVLNKIGALNSSVFALARITKGKEYILIIVLSLIMIVGGTTFGLGEETIALFPILMPVFIVAGYDAMTCIAVIYVGASVGTMYSTLNPFSIGVATKAAGISMSDQMNWRFIALVVGSIFAIGYVLWYAHKVHRDPSKSVCYDMKEQIEERWVYKKSGTLAFTGRMKISLLVFAGAIATLVWGIVTEQWWFDSMTATILCASFILALTTGLEEDDYISTYIAGAGDLMSVALVCGVARAVNILMEDGLISDTILSYFSGVVQGMSPVIFIIVMFFVYCILGFFINSSSGLAVLSIPIMAPLGDAVNVSRAAVISAYNYGQGLISYITPTGLILCSLAMVDVPFSRWMKFVTPLLIGTVGVNLLLLIAQVMFG